MNNTIQTNSGMFKQFSDKNNKTKKHKHKALSCDYFVYSAAKLYWQQLDSRRGAENRPSASY